MNNDERNRELSDAYKLWENDDRNCSFMPAADEVDRLCEVIVGLRAQLAEKEAARAKAMEGEAPSFVQSKGEIESIASMVNIHKEALTPGMLELAPFTAIDVLEELHRRANVIEIQASELAQLRDSLDTAKADRDLWRKNCEGWAPLVDFVAARGDFTPGGHAGGDAERIIRRQDEELARLRADLKRLHPFVFDLADVRDDR